MHLQVIFSDKCTAVFVDLLKIQRSLCIQLETVELARKSPKPDGYGSSLWSKMIL